MATAPAHPLAGRVERAVARNLHDFVDVARRLAPELEPDAVACGDGVAAFLGGGSPLTTVKGIGADPTDAELDTAEAFFRGHGAARATVELTPWTTPASAQRLAQRGYQVVDHEDVVVHVAPAGDGPPPWIEDVDVDAWPELQLSVNEDPITPGWRALALVCAHLPEVVRLGARVDGSWAACAELAPAADVGVLGNDATHPDARGRGAQAGLIRARLDRAAALGMDLVMAEVAPGSSSGRNYLRCGFELAYTRVHWARELA